MFEDRKEAGRKLGQALAAYETEEPLVLAIPRGGVEVAFQVAEFLKAPLSVIVARKLPFPDNPESGFGAVAEDGTVVLIGDVSVSVPDDTIKKIIKQQRQEVKRRIEILRKGRLLPELKDKTVILVDDGIAMGSTMRAAVTMCRNKGAGKIVVAAPVAGPEVVIRFAGIADDIVVLEKPANFRAVAQVYRNWYDVSDEEVTEIMEKAELRQAVSPRKNNTL